MRTLSPDPTNTGVTLYEVWELSPDEEPYLLLVTSNAVEFPLRPGDMIVSRTWAPAGPQTYVNSARLPDAEK